MSDQKDVRGINTPEEAFWTVVIAAWIVVGIPVALSIGQLTIEMYLNGVKLIIIGMMLHVVLASLYLERRCSA